MSDSDDVISGDSSVGEGGWQEQQQYLIEEEIEEVTEYLNEEHNKSNRVDNISTPTSSSESTKKKVVTTKTSKPTTVLSTPYPAIRGDIDCVLADLSHDRKADLQRVPFPEFGVDIVFRKTDESLCESSSDESSSSSSSAEDYEERKEEEMKRKSKKVQQLQRSEVNLDIGLSSAVICNMKTNEWEDNWLFRRRKSKSDVSPTAFRELNFDPILNDSEFVSMLVPNPVEGQEWKTRIGHKDVDEVSEMSERNSEASLDLASLISFSSNDDDVDEDEDRFHSLEEGQQKDLEHTEYSVLPLRRPSKGHHELEEKILTSLSSTTSRISDIEFRVTPKNASTESGKCVTFNCTLDGTKPIDVAWFRVTSLLEDTGDRISFLRRRNFFSFSIFDPRPNDAGTYSCMAVNPVGEKWKQFKLEVKAPTSKHQKSVPSIELKFPQPLEPCQELDQVILNFRVHGYPEPRVIFLKNNGRLQPNENVDIYHNGPGDWSLKLFRCHPRDAGTYQIRAINSSGGTRRKWNLQVRSKPEVPKLRPEAEKRKKQYDTEQRDTERPLAENIKVEVIEKASIAKTDDKMPLYPHSILKKPKEVVGVVKAAKEPDVVTRKGPVEADGDVLDRPAAQPGTIADREHRKWTEQAIRLQNNPYSKESIERRLSRGIMGENLSPSIQNASTRNVNDGERGQFITDNHDDQGVSSSDDGKEHLVISGSDLPRRIDCGPKSANVSRYHRDYYVHSSGAGGNDVIYYEPPKRYGSNSRINETGERHGSSGELVERTKAMLFSRVSVDESNTAEKEAADDGEKLWRQNESSQKSESDNKRSVDNKSDSGEPSNKSDRQTGGVVVVKATRQRSVSMERLESEDEDNVSSDSERLPDSLDDQGVPDSGVGSSSEKTSTLSKVETEIFRFQREIERAAQEKSRQLEWEKRKSSRLGSSMDSLLSVDDLPSESSRGPALPPKGKFVSTGNLNPPPALPPKQRNFNQAVKRVAISTDEVRIIGIGGYSEEDSDYSGEEDSYQSSSMSRQRDPGTYCQPPHPPPDVVPQQFSRQNSVSKEEDEEKKKVVVVQATCDKEKVNDLPAVLPSVKELACKFLPKKSPEPMPRKSLKKIETNTVKDHQPPYPFKQLHQQPEPSREIHSLTARSVPRQFREGLKKSMPEKADRNIKIPLTTQHSDDIMSPTHEQQFDEMTSFRNDLIIVSARRHSSEDVGNRTRVSASNLHIIYDSQKQGAVPYPDADYVRTPSPEHVGIPAGPLRMPIRNKHSISGKNCPLREEYTSDESNASAGPPRNRHPPQNRRKKTTQQI